MLLAISFFASTKRLISASSPVPLYTDAKNLFRYRYVKQLDSVLHLGRFSLQHLGKSASFRQSWEYTPSNISWQYYSTIEYKNHILLDTAKSCRELGDLFQPLFSRCGDEDTFPLSWFNIDAVLIAHWNMVT
jgi:hypothetical protein